MELVTEPVIHSAKETARFGEELQLLLQYLGVAEANMEKGEMRLEANISVSNTDKFGTKVEVKNLNSFKSAERAIEYEIKRQVELLSSGGKVAQETRGWDDKNQVTFSQRSKEDSHDYRYFPDPDLPKLEIDQIKDLNLASILAQKKETPNEKRARFKVDFGIKDSDVEFYIYNYTFSDLFEKSAQFLNKEDLQLLSNYVVSDIANSGKGKLEPQNLALLIKMIVSNELSSRGAKDTLKIMIEKGGDPQNIAKEAGLLQKNDESDLTKIAEKILAKNQGVVLEYRGGKTAALQFLIGQCMKEAKGSANPSKLKEIILRLI
jgi:aspartyl-tRNA(Asn)/glutamyl-tRNA(Gln) amidotransferase subunit B